MTANQDYSSQKRTWTAVVQGFCGLVAIACSIALIVQRTDGDYVGLIDPWGSQLLANAGFGGVVFVATAILGCIYRSKKRMVSAYAAFSLVSMVVAFGVFWVALSGVARAANRDICQYPGYRYGNYDDPWDERQQQCREEIERARPASLSLYSILLLVSVVEFIASVTAAVLSFIVTCRECCCQTTPRQTVYLVDPVSGRPGSVPMVFAPGMTPGSQQTTELAANPMASPYSPQMAVRNPDTTADVNQGNFRGPQGTLVQAMDDGAKEYPPPPRYEP